MARLFSLVALLTIATLGVDVGAQTLSSSALKDPPWLLLELGKKAFREKNFGQALDYFRTSIANGVITPEAQMWIGRVFEEEGELDLAENQYQKALADSSQFEIPDEAAAIRYDLARIYYNTNQYGKYEVTLKNIVSEDKEYSDPKEAFTRRSMVRVLKTDGLDKLLVLYRLTNKKTLQAHSDLGELYYRTGRYSDAIMNLTFSTITILSVAIDRVAASDPQYEFSTIGALFDITAKNTTVTDYLSSANLFKDLYYLAASLYAEGTTNRATAIWRTVTRWSQKDAWYRQSAAQLRSPHIEPIMNIGN